MQAKKQLMRALKLRVNVCLLFVGEPILIAPAAQQISPPSLSLSPLSNTLLLFADLNPEHLKNCEKKEVK